MAERLRRECGVAGRTALCRPCAGRRRGEDICVVPRAAGRGRHSRQQCRHPALRAADPHRHGRHRPHRDAALYHSSQAMPSVCRRHVPPRRGTHTPHVVDNGMDAIPNDVALRLDEGLSAQFRRRTVSGDAPQRRQRHDRISGGSRHTPLRPHAATPATASAAGAYDVCTRGRAPRPEGNDELAQELHAGPCRQDRDAAVPSAPRTCRDASDAAARGTKDAGEGDQVRYEWGRRDKIGSRGARKNGNKFITLLS